MGCPVLCCKKSSFFRSSTYLYLSGEELEQIGKLEKGVEPKFGRKQDATEDLVQMEQDEASE